MSKSRPWLIWFLVVFDDLDGVKRAYIAGRELRGFPANLDATNRIFTPEGIKASTLISGIFGLVGIGALIATRRYFFGMSSKGSENSV